jgi:hypothetical protein
MYELSDYLAMVEDPVRTPAYLAAMARVIRPGDHVVEIGTGFGYFAVAACQRGAAHVWAIEPNDAIAHGGALAAANGCADRITFVQDVSESVELPRRVDVLIEDLRGVSPLNGRRLAVLADAHRRFLVPGARTIPARDHLFCAPSLWPPSRESHPADAPVALHGVALGDVPRAAARRAIRSHAGVETLLAEGRRWATLDFGAPLAAEHPVSGEAAFVAERDGSLAAIASWFTTELAPGIGFGTGPGEARTVYDHALLPLENPVAVARGDHIEVCVRAVFDGADHAWSWEVTIVPSGGGQVSTQRGATLGSRLLSSARRRRRAASHRPAETPALERMRALLAAVDGTTSLERIAARLAERFPGHFPDDANALRWAGERLAELEEPRPS